MLRRFSFILNTKGSVPATVVNLPTNELLFDAIKELVFNSEAELALISLKDF